MPRPPKPLQGAYRNSQDFLMVFTDGCHPPVNPRLSAIYLAHMKFSRESIADCCKVTSRTIRRWFAAWNEGGPDLLLKKPKRRGRKRKLSREEFEAKIVPLIHTASGKVAPIWSLAEVKRKAETQLGISIGYSCLRRYFRKLGLRPRRPATPPKSPDWGMPWPPEYGRSMADYLQQQNAAMAPDSEERTAMPSSSTGRHE